MSFLPGTGVRQRHTRTAAALGSLLLVLLCPASVPAQRALIAPQPGMGRLTVAAATPADLRSWDGTIDPSVRGGELVVSRVQEDPVLAGHRHETFVQSYWGIPVYGSSLVRQTAGGVTVSVIGTLLTGITVDPTPTPVRGPRCGDCGGGLWRVPRGHQCAAAAVILPWPATK